jgi:hypothetical protein
LKQLTSKQAIAFYKRGAWKDLRAEALVKFQLFQAIACVPFHEVFHPALNDAFGREVFTHELSQANWERQGLEIGNLKGRPRF